MCAVKHLGKYLQVKAENAQNSSGRQRVNMDSDNESKTLMDTNQQHACSECGIVFDSSYSLQKHEDKCSNDDESDDECAWDELLDHVDDKLDGKFQDTVEQYINEGNNESDAKRLAIKTMRPEYKEFMFDIYNLMLYFNDCLKRNSYHRDVVNTMEDLMKNKGYNRDKAVNYAIKEHKADIWDLVKDKIFASDTDTEDSSESESDD